MISEDLIAFILGIVEGLTEFLPISSTAHLVLAGEILGFKGERANTFEIFIQLGAILAVLMLYWRVFWELFFPKPGSTSTLSGVSGIKLIAAGCIPAVVMGLLFHKAIKAKLFATGPIAVAMIVGGLLMILIERLKPHARTKSLDTLTLRDSIGMGIFQCLALWPGMSRSGSVLIGGLALGVERSVAAQFSFILAVPIMLMATVWDLYKSLDVLNTSDIRIFAIGFVTSFIFAAITVKPLINYLRKYSLFVFGFYRVLVGAFFLWA
jgi:undecaprenyl-diphosphatase